MKAIDTNVLVRLLIRDDPKQAVAAEHFIQTGVWVSTVALAESIWVLQSIYKRTHKEITDVLDVLLQNPKLVVQNEEAVWAALAVFRTRPAAGFTDCLLLELARAHGHLPLGTFDRGLGKLNGAHRL